MSKKPHSASADGEDVLIKDGLSGFLNPAEMFKLRRLALLSRYTVEGNLAGAHRSPKHGPSSEFASHKPYGMGDDPKHIDWRVMARTDKYYVKQYEDETNLRVYLALDRSASMGYKSADGPTKYEHACRLAAAVGYVVVKARDSVGLFLHSENGAVFSGLETPSIKTKTLVPGSTTLLVSGEASSAILE